MTTETLTLEVALPSKRFPDKYASAKSSDGRWFDAPIGMLDGLRNAVKRPTSFVVNQTPKGYWQIEGYAPQLGGNPPSSGYNTPQVHPIVPIAVTAPPTPVPGAQLQPHGIGREEGMYAMAIIGKAFQGTGNLPDVKTQTDLICKAVIAWRNANAELQATPF